MRPENNPASNPKAAMSAGATSMPRGMGVATVSSTPFLCANAPHTKRSEYAIVRTEPTTAPARPTHAQKGWVAVCSRSVLNTASLATKPSSGGRPAMEAAASTATRARTRWLRHSPDISRRSRVPVCRSIMPTVKNKVALKAACPISSAIPASATLESPNASTNVRKPSWLTVP